MGLTIHYTGRIKSNSLIESMTSEIADVCAINGWAFGRIDRVLEGVPADLIAVVRPDQPDEYRAQGCYFKTAAESESLVLCFGPDGLTLSPMALHRPDLTDWDDAMLAHHSFAKTQDGGAEAHMKLCRFLKYLADKYFLYLEVNDEGQFYSTGDEALLRRNYAGTGNFSAQVKQAVEGAARDGAQSLTELVARITEALPDVDIRILGDSEEE